MKELILRISESDFIKITTGNNIDFNKASYCCTQLEVCFFDKKQKINIGKQSIGEIFEPFITCLKKAIRGDLRLHESLIHNLGLMQNQYYHDNTGFVQISESNDMSPYWIGFNYQICSVSGDVTSSFTVWLYNDFNENIIFQVTKDYPWHFTPLNDDFEDKDFITYEEFMKNYKPLITRVISRDIAELWLGQLMKVYRGLFKSEEDYQDMCKELGWQDC